MIDWVLLTANLWHIADLHTTDDEGLRTACGLEVPLAEVRRHGRGDMNYVFPRCPCCVQHTEGKSTYAT